MRLLLVSDIHGHFEGAARLADEIRAADAVLIAGDLTDFGGGREAAAAVQAFAVEGVPVHAVLGNCDHPGAGSALLAAGRCLECSPVVLGSGDVRIAAIGSGGGLSATGATPNEKPECDMADALEGAWVRLGRDPAFAFASGALPKPDALRPLAIVSHTPPYGTEVDKALGVKHAGSRLLRAFVERTRPLLVLSGHIHESAAVGILGGTTLVNPGPFKKGHYAVAELLRAADGTWSVRAELRRLPV